MNNIEVFSHHKDTVLKIATLGGFDVIKEAASQALFTGMLSPIFNFVWLADPKVLDKALARHLPFLCIPHCNTNPNFEATCTEYGLSILDSVEAHVFTDLPDWSFNEDLSVEIRPVCTSEQLDAFDAISSESFYHPRGFASKFLTSALGNKDVLLFLAYSHGQPVGAALLSLLVPENAGLYWDCVLPSHRNKGIASALTRHRMDVAKKRGFLHICSQNMASSVGYYRRLGFKPVGSLPMALWAGAPSLS